MRRSMLLISGVLAIAVAGCGEGRDAGLEAGAPSDPAALEVVATEFALDPAEARAPRPGRLRVRLVNEGEESHALAVQGPTGEVVTAPVAPGEWVTLIAQLPAGTYKWSCPLGDHERRGMRGTLRVAE